MPELRFSDRFFIKTSEFFHVLIHVSMSLSMSRVSSKQSNFFFGLNQNEPKLNLFRLFFGLFRETKQIFFRFVSVCFGVSVRYRNNRNKPKQTEKISKKQISIRVSSKQLIFFSVRTETNRNSTCFGCFSVCFFREIKQHFFRFVSVFRTGIKITETNRTYCMEN
jgi:hypothetical protein